MFLKQRRSVRLGRTYLPRSFSPPIWLAAIAERSSRSRSRVRARRAPSEFLGYITGAFCAVCAHKSAARRPTTPPDKVAAGINWPCSVYTGRPSAVATRDLTQIGEPHSISPPGPGIACAARHALRNTPGRAFSSGDPLPAADQCRAADAAGQR